MKVWYIQPYQEKQQLKKKSRSDEINAEKLINDLYTDIKDRMVTSDCLETYKRKDDENYIHSALKRKEDFDFINKKNFCSW